MELSTVDKEWNAAVEKERKDAKERKSDGYGAVETDSLLGDKPDEHHYSNRTGWLRAMVLGANDGLVSTSSVMMGVAGANWVESGSQYNHLAIVLTGLSALVAGALSMAIGEFVSVHSQKDTEKTDIDREKWELLNNPDKEMQEIVQAYQRKGLSRELAEQVAGQLCATKEKALRAHLAEELNLDQDELSNPLQAAVVSALSFSLGALGPLIMAIVFHEAQSQILSMACISFVELFACGILGAHLGGAPLFRAGMRVLIGGLLALGITFGVGIAFGAATG